MSWRNSLKTGAAAFAAVTMAFALGPAATAQTEARGAPTMLVLDNSGSMVTQDASGQTRSDAAKDATREFIDELDDTLDLGLVTYGGNTGDSPAEYEAGCQDITLVRGPTTGNPDELTEHIDGLEPRGYTPIGESLRAAAAELPADEAGTVVLVSDGLDTCAPPPVCEVAEELHEQGVELVINTVGFNVDDDARAELECIARAAGGTYADAGDAEELVEELQRATTRSARGYESAFEVLNGGATPGEATEIPAELDTFQAHLPPLAGADEEVSSYWSIPVEGYERIQVTTTYAEQTMVGQSNERLLINNKLQMPGAEGDTCHRNLIGESISDNWFLRPTVASIESDRIGVDCVTDNLILSVTRSLERHPDQEIPVEIHVERLAPADVDGLPAGDQNRDLPELNPADVDTWTEAEAGTWFTDATELTSGEGVEAEIVPSESQFFRLPMATGQQLRGYIEVVENSNLDPTVTDLFGTSLHAPTRQSGGVNMRTSLSARDGVSDTFTAPVPVTYLNMFPAGGGFGTIGIDKDVFTFEGDYYIVVTLSDVAGDTTTVGDTALPTLRYRLAAEAYGDPQPGPVFEEVANTTEETPEVETTEAAEPTGTNGALIGVIVAVVVALLAALGWLGMRRRK